MFGDLSSDFSRSEFLRHLSVSGGGGGGMGERRRK